MEWQHWVKVNETYTTSQTEHPGQCPDWGANSLVIADGQARLLPYEGTVGPQPFEGTVEPQGDLLMRRRAAALVCTSGQDFRGARSFPDP
jgi:hypothetical protein